MRAVGSSDSRRVGRGEHLSEPRLRAIPVGIAYAIWSGVGIVLISVIAWVVYRQALDVAAVVGIGPIIAGVCVIQLFSRAAPHSIGP
jgi:small multidrug resistance pump